MEDFVNTPDKKIIEFSQKSRYMAIVNDETGKVDCYVKLKEKNLGEGWVAMYQAALKTIVRWNLSNEQYRVFIALLSELDFDNYLRTSQKNLSDMTGIKQPNIAKALKVLCELNIIVEGPRAGLNKTYRLNPEIAHKGKNRQKTIIEFEKLARERDEKFNGNTNTEEGYSCDKQISD